MSFVKMKPFEPRRHEEYEEHEINIISLCVNFASSYLRGLVFLLQRHIYFLI
jgi:hypothetical protein